LPQKKEKPEGQVGIVLKKKGKKRGRFASKVASIDSIRGGEGPLAQERGTINLRGGRMKALAKGGGGF